MTQNIQTPEQRLAVGIGDLFVINAKLGYEVEMLRHQIAQVHTALQSEKARADAAESQLRELHPPPTDSKVAAE